MLFPGVCKDYATVVALCISYRSTIHLTPFQKIEFKYIPLYQTLHTEEPHVI